MFNNSASQALSVDVFVCTYRRPESLARCLASFAEVAVQANVRLYVIDNDPEGSAHSVVTQFAYAQYVHEPCKGLAAARNRAIKEGKADYIAYIDDDEVVSLSWLTEARTFLANNPSDVMFGGTKPVYPEHTPQWILEVDAFAYRTHQHGEAIECSGSGNVFIRRAVFKESGLQFDPKFSATGGEDSRLFRQLYKLGYTLYWNDRIYVNEYIEPNRLNKRYLLTRAFRDGQCYARTYLPIISSKQKAIWFVKRLVALGLDVFRLAWAFCKFSKAARVTAYRQCLKDIGQLSILTGRYVSMYD